MNEKDIIDITMKIEGWFELADIISMHKIVSEYDSPISFLELGSWKGRSTTCIGLSLPQNSTLKCVDTFMGSDNEISTAHIEAREEGDPIYKQFMKNINILKQYRPDLDVIIHRGTTKECIDFFEDLEFDIIFIDSNHTFEYIRWDFFNYYCKCKDDGLIIGHDYHIGCPGIVKFVDTFIRDYVEFYPQPQGGCSLWSAKKRDISLNIKEIVNHLL